MQKTRLFVDMDGTLNEFNKVARIEELYEKGYFYNLNPHENVVNAIKDLIKDKDEEGIDVYILSCYLSDSSYAIDEKNMWLDDYLPEIDAKHRIFVPCGTDKKDAVTLREDDYLLDDYTLNLLNWEPARGIKLINGINDTHGTWSKDRVYFDDDPDQIAGDILYIMKDKELKVEKPKAMSFGRKY